MGMEKRTAGKKSKGSVGVEVNQGRLRIRLPRHIYGGVQKYFYPGLSDTKEHWRIARAKAQQIESDIVFERFDPTLEKYKPPVYEPPAPRQQDPINLSTLWDAYTVYKSKSLSPSSLKDFRKTKNHLAKSPTLSLDQARTIATYLRENLTADAARRVLMQISACCQWAVDGGLIDENPFAGKIGKVKVQRNLNISPFTAGERDLIIQAFESDEYHQHYAAFVKFLFATGCRTSEAVGLLWLHIDPDLRVISFQEAVVDGVRTQSTKTHKSRRFPVNDSLRELLESIKPTRVNPKSSVFTDQHENLVRPNNFLRRHWQPIVKSLGIAYRPQYNTRHTFITLCLEARVPVAQVAAWVGNSPKVIWEHYAGLIQGEVPPL